jgi:hypothetical protein
VILLGLAKEEIHGIFIHPANVREFLIFYTYIVLIFL